MKPRKRDIYFAAIVSTTLGNTEVDALTSTHRPAVRKQLSSSKIRSAVDDDASFGMFNTDVTPLDVNVLWDHSHASDFVVQEITQTSPRDVLPRGAIHHAPTPPHDPSKIPSYPTLLAFGGTTVLMWLAEPLLSLVDTAVVGLTQGATSVVQLAAMGPATSLMDALLYMTYFLALATTNLISEQLALQNYRNLQQHTSHLMGVAALCGLGVTGIVFSAGPTLLQSMAGVSATPELLTYALRYTQIRALVAPLAVTAMVGQNHALATFDNKRPILAVAVASVINIAGDLWLSKWGVVGAATATAAATAGSSLILLHGVWKRMQNWRKQEVEETKAASADENLVRDSLMERLWANATATAQVLDRDIQRKLAPTKVPLLSLPDRKSFVDLLRLSGPLMFNMWAKMLAYSALTVRATNFGVVAMAAQNIMMRVFFFFGCFADALGATAQAFLPSTLYPRKDEIAYGKILQRLGLFAGITALFISHVSMWLLIGLGGKLASDASVVATMKTHAPLVGLSLLLHPLVVAMEGTVIATRNFRTLVRTYVVSWGVHATLLFGACASFGGIWRSLVSFQVARLINYAIRRRRTVVVPS